MRRIVGHRAYFFMKRDWTGSVYAFMDEYADIKLEDLRGKLIDGPTNLMQLVTIFHELVDDLRMSLIPLRVHLSFLGSLFELT